MRYVCFSFLLLISFTSAFSQPIITTVPFQNIILGNGGSLQASYSFGSFSMIFCFATNTKINGLVSWPLNGQTQTSQLPVSLITNGKFQGSFADASGTITIQNNVDGILQVGCVFGY